MQSKFITSKKMTRLAVIAVFLFGLCLVLVGVLFEESLLASSILNTVGIACVVSISTSLLQRHFTYETQYLEMIKNVEERIDSLLKSRFDILDACSEAGIRHLYPEWPAFLQNTLPSRLKNVQKSFLAIGIGLSDLSQACVSGALREVIRTNLASKAITFRVVNPDKGIVDYRETELKAVNSTRSSVESSISFLNDLHTKNNKIRIEKFDNILPRATILCLDDEVIFYAPYFSAIRTPVSFVIETHKGDPFFERIREDIGHFS